MSMKKAAAAFLAVLMMMTAFLSVGMAAASEKDETETVNTEAASAAAETAAEETAETAAGQAADAVLTDNAAEQAVTGGDNQRLDAAYTLALNAINAEDYETAKEYINICFAYCDAQSNPVLFSDLLLKRACIDVIEDKLDMALLNLDAALRVDPELADAYLVQTQVYATQGDADRAISSLEKYIELSGDTSLYETIAQLYEAKGDTQGAQDAYNKYVQGAGAEVEEAAFQSGLYMMQNGDYEGAIAAFQPYEQNETYGAGAMYNIGVSYMNLGNYAEAVEAFNSCEEKGGTFEGLFYNRGICRLLSADWEGAADDFTKSIETEPYVDDARYNLAICQMQMEEYDNAIETFTEYIGDGAQTAEDGQEQTEVENDTDRVINFGAYFYRGACLAAMGQLEEAAADYTVCIENQYDLGQSYYQRAQVYAALGDTEKQNADLAESLKYAE